MRDSSSGGGAPTGAPTVAWDLVGRWLEQADADSPDLDALVLASPADLEAWLAAERGAHVLVRPATLAHVLASARRTAVGLALPPGRRPGAWDLLEAGLLRVVCGLTFAEVAERLGVAATTAHARVRLHFGALGGAAYAGTAGAVLHCALGLEYGALLSPLGRALPGRRSG